MARHLAIDAAENRTWSLISGARSVNLQNDVCTAPKNAYDSQSPAQTARCTACNCDDWTDFFSIRGLPVHVGIFYPDAEAARATSRGEITLSFCHHCGHVFNRTFDSTKVDYRPGYEVALNHSAVFRAFMDEVADRLIARFDLKNKTILEIGVGSGYFLKLLCKAGSNRGVGIDPTVPQEGLFREDQSEVELIRKAFDESFAERFREISPDFVCCLSVLEHIAEPNQMLRSLRAMIGQQAVAVYFEIFNAARAFKSEEIWSIHYEQCNYFSERSFSELFRRNDFDVLSCGSCYGGDQYLFVDAVAATADARASAASSGQFRTAAAPVERQPIPTELISFSASFDRRRAYWTKRLDDFRQSSEKVVFWGTGGKGISFLNLLNTADVIPYVAESNPAKQGKYVPGPGTKIVSPAFLAEYRPAEIIISNALYADEIKRQVTQLGVECRFSVA
jgi:hypothetical protein